MVSAPKQTSNQKLNKIQLNRLQDKLRSLISRKVAAWNDQNPEPKPISLEKMLESIKSGKAKLKSVSELKNHRHLYLEDAFVFPENVELKKLQEKHSSLYKKYQDALRKESEKIMDQAIFISCEAALEMIQKFEAFEPS